MTVPTHGEQRYALGFDVGGTKIAAGLVALRDGTIVRRQIIPTDAWRGGLAVLRDAVGLAEGLVASSGLTQPLSGIGIGVAELVDGAGNVTSGHTIAWRGLGVAAAFAHLAPTRVESDVRAHALAEARLGAGKPWKLFVYVSIGTGISSCLVQDGQPFSGARGNALVLATSPVSTYCPTCDALHPFVLEDYAAGPALVVRYNERSAHPLMRAEQVFAAAQAGDPLAITVLSTAGEALGSSIAWLVNVLDPEAVVIGGGLGLAGGLFWDALVATARAHIWHDSARDLPLLRAALGADAGLLGAALAAVSEPEHNR